MAGVKSRLLVLGAGLFQVTGIRKARALGYHVITVDYLPDNIGHTFADESADCSTTDCAGILAVARERRADGIITFCSDVAIPAVAHTAETMGWPGVSRDAAHIMTDKAAFRRFQRDQGLACPRVYPCGTREETAGLDLPDAARLVCKPVDSSGSRGITVVDATNAHQLDRAIAHAAAFSRSGRVCIEEYIDGTEVGGDGFMVQGRLAFSVLTHKHKRGVVVTGHSLPTNVPEADACAVRAEIERCCRLLGYHDGPLNFDVMVHPGGPTILEMSPRHGGNGITELLRVGTGVDILATAVHHAMGRPIATGFPAAEPQACGSLVLGSAGAGVIARIATADEIRQRVPEVVECVVAKRPGEANEAFVHGGAALGYAVFTCPRPHDYQPVADRVMQALQLEVTPQKEQSDGR